MDWPEQNNSLKKNRKCGYVAIQTLHMTDVTQRPKLTKFLLGTKVSQLQMEDLSRDCPLPVRVTARWRPIWEGF